MRGMQIAGVAKQLCAAAVLSVTATGCMGMARGGAMSPADMELHSVSMASHTAEIEEAQLALTRATNPAVRQYAQRMVTEHTAAMQREHEMMGRMGMHGGAHHAGGHGGAAAGSGASGATAGAATGGAGAGAHAAGSMHMQTATSRMMVENHQQAMAALGRVTGAAFDRAYVQRQVAAHQYTLTNMDRIAPRTMAMRIPEQRALVESNRAMVAAHLQQAQQLAGSAGR